MCIYIGKEPASACGRGATAADDEEGRKMKGGK
jgi:hypothetical protein